MPLSRHVETKTQSPSSGVGCLLAHLLVMPPGAVRRSSRLSSRPSARPACLPYMPYVVSSSHPLIISPARPRSSHPLPTGSAACVIPFASPHRLIGSPFASYRPAPRIIDKRSGEKPQSTAGVSRRVNGGGCLLASEMAGAAGDHRLRMAGGSSLRGCDCLLASWRWTGRLGHLSSPSHRLIQSTGWGLLFLFARPLPPALLCLLAVTCSPVPGRGMCGLRHGLRWRAAGCLLAFLVPRSALSLPLVRLLLCEPCRSCRSFLLGVLWGVLWAILPAILSALEFFKTCP